MTLQSERSFLLVNPLPSALRHYELELRSILDASGLASPSSVKTASIEGHSSTSAKLFTTFTELLRRTRGSDHAKGSIILVLWPAFGLYDFLTWWRRARTNHVFLVVHDPIPLRKSHGNSRLANFLFARLIHKSRVNIICHTEVAAQALSATGIRPLVLPHPVLDSDDKRSNPDRVVRILGQFKTARRTHGLADIARWGNQSGIRFEIAGRGWPEINGWTRIDRFLEEDEFQHLISSSACVLLPYNRFYQSGVAVRCLESGTPIVAMHHEQLDELYGADWPGLVDSETDWTAAIQRILVEGNQGIIYEARRAYRQATVARWSDWIASTGL